MRALILILFYVGVLGTAAELVLLGHYEDYRQWAPLALFASSLGAGIGLAVGPRKQALRIFRWVAIGFVIAGFTGVYYHYVGNADFELEMYPTLSGFDLLRESLTGATPALAPGSVAHLGLLGLLYTFRHPELARGEVRTERLDEED